MAAKKKAGHPRLKHSHTTRIMDDRIRRRSRLVSPVKLCWEIFDQLKLKLGVELTRKYAIDYAEKQGIAFYTARTQWHEWQAAGWADKKARHAAVKKYGEQGMANLKRIGLTP